MTALDAADFFLGMSQPNEGDFLTLPKLQSLIYYGQGSSLVLLGRPLYDEDIVWTPMGPVVQSLRQRFGSYGVGALPASEAGLQAQPAHDERELLVEVWNVYGQFAAWKLVEMCRVEAPVAWAAKTGSVSRDDMSRFFRGLVE